MYYVVSNHNLSSVFQETFLSYLFVFFFYQTFFFIPSFHLLILFQLYLIFYLTVFLLRVFKNETISKVKYEGSSKRKLTAMKKRTNITIIVAKNVSCLNFFVFNCFLCLFPTNPQLFFLQLFQWILRWQTPDMIDLIIYANARIKLKIFSSFETRPLDTLP